jgi:hypothetical protein
MLEVTFFTIDAQKKPGMKNETHTLQKLKPN